MAKQENTQGKSGRPPLPLPEPIGRPMEEIVDTVFRAPPKRKDEWEYIRKYQKPRSRRRDR